MCMLRGIWNGVPGKPERHRPDGIALSGMEKRARRMPGALQWPFSTIDKYQKFFVTVTPYIRGSASFAETASEVVVIVLK